MIPELSFKMAYRHVRAGFGRMALSVVAIALGVGLVVAFQLMNAAVLQSFLDTVDAMAGRAQLTVSAGEGLTFSEDLIATVAAVPGVKLAVPLVRSVAFPDDGSGEMLTVQGVDLTHEAAVRLYHDAEHTNDVIDDLVEFLNAPGAIIVGREFAERRGLTKGSTVDLVTPTGVKTFTIKGLLDPQGLARTLRGRLVVMDLFAAERAFTADRQINQIDVVVADAHDIEAVKTSIIKVLPAALKVDEPAFRRDVVRRTVSGFQAMMTAFSLLAVVAGFVVCYSRLRAVFEARTWEVGLLRAVGLPQFTVFGELLKESLLLGVCGTVLGLGLGSLIGYLGLPFLASTTAIALDLPAPSANTVVRVQALIFGSAVGLAAAVAAAAAPALRLARTEPVAALTLRGREMPAASSKIRWRFRLGLLGLTSGMILWCYMANAPIVGNIVSVLLMIAACALATPLVAAGCKTITRAWQMTTSPLGRLGVEPLVRQPRRTALTVATLGVGGGTVLLFGMLGWSFERTLASRLTGLFHGDLAITSAIQGVGGREARFNQGALDQLRTIPGVALVAGVQQGQVQSTLGPVTLTAYDSIGFRERRVFQWHLAEGAVSKALELVESGNAAMVSTGFAYEHKSRPGDSVELIAPDGYLRLPIVAVTFDEPSNAVIISRERYRASWNDPMVWQAHVVLEPGYAPAAAEAVIARELGTRFRLRVQSTPALVEHYAGLVHQAFSVLYLCEALVFLLVLVGIGDTLASSVVERTREFGMMRAVGLSRSGLFSMVMIEAAAIGLLGLTLAGVAGLVQGIFWVNVQFPVILGWALELHFPTRFALGAAALTMNLCLIGSLLPAWRATRLSVPAALRNE